MVAKRQVQEFRQWATLGAQQRLLQIQEEQAAIFRAFPELRRGTRGRPPTRSGGGGGESETGSGTNATNPAGGRRKRRRKISAEGRKRISEAQKARWAKQRATAASGDTGARKKR